VQQLLDKDP